MNSQRCLAIPVCALVAMVIGLSSPPSALADDVGEFDGAIWNFTMTPKKPGLQKLTGRFRVSDNVLYQKEDPADPEFKKQVGKNHPKGKVTRAEFTDLRAFTPDKEVRTGIKGTARLKGIKFGEWTGVLTDGRGRNWEFQCTRVQE